MHISIGQIEVKPVLVNILGHAHRAAELSQLMHKTFADEAQFSDLRLIQRITRKVNNLLHIEPTSALSTTLQSRRVSPRTSDFSSAGNSESDHEQQFETEDKEDEIAYFETIRNGATARPASRPKLSESNVKTDSEDQGESDKFVAPKINDKEPDELLESFSYSHEAKKVPPVQPKQTMALGGNLEAPAAVVLISQKELHADDDDIDFRKLADVLGERTTQDDQLFGVSKESFEVIEPLGTGEVDDLMQDHQQGSVVSPGVGNKARQ